MQSLDLTELIREHAESVDAAVTPVSYGELLGPALLVTPGPVRGHGRRNNWLVAVAAAAAILVVVGGVGFLRGPATEPVGTLDGASVSAPDLVAPPCAAIPGAVDPQGSSGCALTDLRIGYWQAWNIHDADAVLGYMTPPATLSIATFDETDFITDSASGEEVRDLLEVWFAREVNVENLGGGGGGANDHFNVELNRYTSEATGSTSNAIDIWLFTADPFTAAKLDPAPIVAHYSFQIGDRPIPVTVGQIVNQLQNPNGLDSFAEFLGDFLSSPPASNALEPAATASVERGLYIGVTISSAPATTRLDDFSLVRLSSAGPMRAGSIQLFRDWTEPRQDLILLVNGKHKVTDSLLLHDATGVRLGVSCVGSNPVVLVDESGTAIRAWKATTDQTLIEVPVAELTTSEVESACITNV